MKSWKNLHKKKIICIRSYW